MEDQPAREFVPAPEMLRFAPDDHLLDFMTFA
jgi:hypothetical protein